MQGQGFSPRSHPLSEERAESRAERERERERERDRERERWGWLGGDFAQVSERAGGREKEHFTH